jgi:hypothetical protein
VSLEILPKQALLETGDAPFSSPAKEKYSDGAERDVTNLSSFQSNNDKQRHRSPPTASVHRRQPAARRSSWRGSPRSPSAPGHRRPEGPEVRLAERCGDNYIDGLVNAKLKKLRILPSELCDDETFLRRVYVDIVGMLPTAAEHATFVASTDPQKREKLVDELLARPEFVEMWVMKFAELLENPLGAEHRQLQVGRRVLQLAARASGRQRADRQDRARAGRLQRRDVQERGHKTTTTSRPTR